MQFSLRELIGWMTAIAVALVSLQLLHSGIGILGMLLLLLFLLVRLEEIWPKAVVVCVGLVGSVGIFVLIALSR
jgi:hypothetical protein